MSEGKVLHERTDAKSRVVIWGLVGIAILLAVSFVGMKLVFDKFSELSSQSVKTEINPLEVPAGLPPAPRLQASSAADMAQLRVDEANVIGKYAWKDKAAGTVQIPVEQAIAILGAKGLPDWKPAPSAETPAVETPAAETPAPISSEIDQPVPASADGVTP